MTNPKASKKLIFCVGSKTDLKAAKRLVFCAGPAKNRAAK